MFKIRKIQTKDYKKAAYIKSIAFNVEQDLQQSISSICDNFKLIENIDGCDVYVCLVDDELAGLINICKFSMNFYGTFINISALGGVSVHINYRNMGVANEMVSYFLNRAKKEDSYITMLYPFRPSFYKKFGFGWGTEKFEYTVSAADFECSVNKRNIDCFMPDSLKHVKDIHERYAKQTHGMCLINELEWHNFENEINDDSIMLIKDDTGAYTGYAIVRFEKDSQYNPYDQIIVIERLITLTPQADKMFFSYISSLKDQFQTVKILTHDPYFYYNFSNAGSIYNAIIQSGYHYLCRQGAGIMYKAINAQSLLNLLPADEIKNGYCFIISDKYNNSNVKAYLGNKKNYKEIYVDADDFSSWIMGCIPALQLYTCGKMITDQNTAAELDIEVKLSKPICMSTF